MTRRTVVWRSSAGLRSMWAFGAKSLGLTTGGKLRQTISSNLLRGRITKFANQAGNLHRVAEKRLANDSRFGCQHDDGWSDGTGPPGEQTILGLFWITKLIISPSPWSLATCCNLLDSSLSSME